MSICIWRGDAQAVAQVDHVFITQVEVGDTFSLTVNRKQVSFTATAPLAENVYQGLATAITSAALAEFPTASVVAATAQEPSYLRLTGRADGTPYEISGSASSDDAGTIDVQRLQAGQPGRNMKQRIALPTGISGGSFTLSWAGETTVALDYDATAAEVETALEAFSNVGNGNVSVTGDPAGPWVVEFTSALASSAHPLISGSGASLTGQAVSVTEVRSGESGTNFRGHFLLRTTSSQPSSLTIAGLDPLGNPDIGQVYPNNLRYDTAWRLALQEALGCAYSDVLVTLTDLTTPGSSTIETRIEFEIAGTYAGRGNMSLTPAWASTGTTLGANGSDSIALTISDAGGSTSNERQLVTLPGSPSGGTFTLTFQGQTTAGVPFNASPAALQSALEALSYLDEGDIVVTAGSVGGWQIEFQSTLASQNLSLLTGNGTNLSGGSIAVSTSQSAQPAVNERVIVSLGQEVSGGTFTLTHSGNTTSNIAANATAATLDSAMEALTHLSPGDILVSGNPSGPWTIEFTGNLASTDVGAVTASGDELIGGVSPSISIESATEPTGPTFWDNAQNWSGGAIPKSGDTAIFEQSASPVKYGLDQSAVTLALLDVRASYTGTIGLPHENREGNTPYIEYRAKWLQIGATQVRIGAGEGSGSERIRLDLGSSPSSVTILSTATPPRLGQYAVALQGTHAANELFVYQGTVGLAPGSGESALFAKVQTGFQDNQASDVELYAGSNVTLGDVVIHGGIVTFEGGSATAISSLWMTAGEVVLQGSDGVNQLHIDGGTLYYRTTGTLGGNTVVSGEGGLSFVGDLRPKTVTNAIVCQGDAALVEDPQQSVTSLTVAYQSTTRLAELGTNVTLSRT